MAKMTLDSIAGKLFFGFAALFGLALLVMTSPTLAQNEEEMAPCRETETARALDFWIGSWEVSDGRSTLYGLNRIEWDAGGCAIHEYWENSEGARGTSLFYYVVNEDSWHQVWVTEDTSTPWGLKLKDLVEVFDNGAVRFQGALTSNHGNAYLDRTTLTPNGDGTVQQLIEISMDSGETWRTTFDAVYSPAGN